MTATATVQSAIHDAVEAVEHATVLDPPAKAAGKAVRGATGPGATKDLLSGTWLGHALHPLMTDVVIGAWTSGLVLDVLGGDDEGRAARRLVGVGIVASLPTAVTGASDWADAEPADDRVRRSGVVHALSNTVALGLQTASWMARRRGDRRRGIALSAAAGAAMAVSGHLGGHLSYVRGVGVDQTAFDEGPEDWVAVDADVPADGTPVTAVVEDTPVLLVRHDHGIHAIHDRCSHRGCSLAEGRIDGDVVECGCHGSRFSLADGGLQRGPATTPQPAFDVRESGGRLELRRRT